MVCFADPFGDPVDVSTVTLDSALKDWGRVDFIKIDVEGAEAHVFKGMQKTIQRHPNVIVCMEVSSVIRFLSSNSQPAGTFCSFISAIENTTQRGEQQILHMHSVGEVTVPVFKGSGLGAGTHRPYYLVSVAGDAW